MAKPPGRVVLSWVGLMLLLATTFGAAFLPIGKFNIVVALAIGAAKAAIVVLVFMELAQGHPLRRLFAGVGLFWLVVMYGLSMTDYLTRTGWPRR